MKNVKNEHNRSAKTINVDRLRDALIYDAWTGHLTWEKRPVEHFRDVRTANSWNSRYAGRRAFITVMSNGYLKGCFDYVELLAHRVAWAIMMGHFPDGDIDHINGNRSDNRARNLRECDRSENLQNQKFTGNRTGVLGVYVHKASGLYAARIQVRRKTISLGYFDNLESARNARLAAERHYGFHSNHGRSA